MVLVSINKEETEHRSLKTEIRIWSQQPSYMVRKEDHGVIKYGFVWNEKAGTISAPTQHNAMQRHIVSLDFERNW